jgi:hypothetical protein
MELTLRARFAAHHEVSDTLGGRAMEGAAMAERARRPLDPAPPIVPVAG